LKFRFLF